MIVVTARTGLVGHQVLGKSPRQGWAGPRDRTRPQSPRSRRPGARRGRTGIAHRPRCRRQDLRLRRLRLLAGAAGPTNCEGGGRLRGL